MKTMSIKLKLAALAAVATLAAPAFAADYDVTGNLVGEDVVAIGQGELAGAGSIDPIADGHVAFINQESANNSAYIEQTGATNFSVIVQTGTDLATAVVYQLGDLNRAVVYQY
jgi:hypothetical protein